MADGEKVGREQEQDSEGPSEELVLGALERAIQHRAAPRLAAGATLRELYAHLALTARSAAARELRSRLAALEARGLIARDRAHGVTTWTLGEGSRELIERTAAALALPESPQHARWRRARRLAQTESGRLAADLRDSLQRCATMLQQLDGPPGRLPRSDDWFALAELLRRDCRRVGSAQHILREWAEPDDGRADTDTLSDPFDHALGERLPAVKALRAGRRNTRLWRERS